MDNIIIYNTDGKINVKLYANDGTVWSTQKSDGRVVCCQAICHQ